MQKLINELGNQYGLLKVVDLCKDKNNRTAWKCICSCGKEVIARGPDLRAGKIVSCGSCRAMKNELNKKYGSLTVIEKVENSKSKNTKWKCLCDCGNIVEVSGRCLRNGDTKSCGCIKSQGELLISKFLMKNNILFQKEFSFDNCLNNITNKPFRFDFIVFNKEKFFLIEYDGIQHFRKQNWNHISFEEIQRRDRIKNQYCSQKGIPLLRISYKEINKIEKIISTFIANLEE